MGRFAIALPKKVKNTLFLTWIFVSIFSVTGCLQEGSTGATSVAPDDGTGGKVVDLGFAGLGTIQDLDGSTIRLTWTLATSPSVVSYRVYSVAANGTLSGLQTLDSTKTAFTHTGLTLGATYSYLVRAVDGSGNSDGNMIIKSMHTFGGISSVTATGLATATVSFTSTSSYSGLNIYYKPARSGTWTLAGTASSVASSYHVTGLKSGTTYQFKVNAADSSGTDDTNPAVLSAQTSSYSFSPPVPQSPRYKGVILAQAYGASPSSPTGTAQSRQITIVWLNFFTSGLPAGSTNTYALIRTQRGQSVDVSTTTACTTSITTSCLVGTQSLSLATESGVLTDTNVGAPPIQYDYIVSWMSGTNWPEELPLVGSDVPYRITVPVPPDNMVLVHRESVNYEQCKLMGRTPLPLENNRCQLSTTMWGAVPYNSGPSNNPLNLDAGYFDFGYNLFVDRYTLACNWSSGNGYNGGPYYGNTAPNNSYGSNDAVYYRTDTGQCSIKVSGTWRDANYNSSGSSLLNGTQYATLATNNPGSNGGYRPPLTNISQNQSVSACASQVDPYYGAKRLLRHREFIAAAAWPKFTGEPNAKTDQQISDFEAGAGANPHTLANGYRCNSTNHANITQLAFTLDNLAGDAGDVIRAFNIGSIETSGCMSRFGLQDHVGNVWQWNSDQMKCRSSTVAPAAPYDTIDMHSCIGVTSPHDSGNNDIDGFKFDGATHGPGGTSAGQTGPNYTTEWTIQSASNGPPNTNNYNAIYFNTALGLPMINNDNGNAVTVSSFVDSFGVNKLHSDRFYLYTDNNNASRGLLVGGAWGSGSASGRWDSAWYSTPTATSYYFGLRCAVPAE